MKQIDTGGMGSVAKSFPDELLDANPGAVLIVGEDGVITDANSSVEELIGSPRGQLVDSLFSHHFLRGDEAEHYVRSLFLAAVDSNTVLIAVGYLGRRVHVLCNARIFPCPVSGLRKAFVILQDVTEFKQYQAQLEFQSTRDPLTSLLNRVQVREQLQEVIENTKESGQLISLILVDIGGFKDVNDAFGHDVGDELLKSAAVRLAREVDDSIAIGRVGGNEFAVVSGGYADVGKVEQLAVQLALALDDPYFLDGHEIVVSNCIGISLYPSDGDDADAMLHGAAVALRCAKQEGDGSIKFFTSDMNRVIRRRIQIGNCLHRALDEGEFELHYQPQARLADGSISGAEALIRWHSGELGTVPPGEFIPVAEQRGHIVPIGEWVLNQACEQGVKWHRQFGRDLKVAVNLSGRQFFDEDVVKVVDQALSRTGLPAKLLELELTESMLMSNTKRMLDILYAFKELGVGLAIDDFGTGYSSLAYLKRFPLDYLKIDRSFLVDIPGRRSDEAIAKTIIAMSHSLGLKVIAEGVENYAQLDFLLGYGCDEMQGYLLAKPMSADEISAFIQQGGGWAGWCEKPMDSYASIGG